MLVLDAVLDLFEAWNENFNSLTDLVYIYNFIHLSKTKSAYYV